MQNLLAHCGRIVECSVALLVAQWQVRRRPFSEIARTTSRPISVAALPMDPLRSALDVRGAMGSVCRRLPRQPTCLVRALAAQAVLRRRHIPSEVVLSVAPSDGDIVNAHAWLEAAGTVVTGRNEMTKFSPIYRLGNYPVSGMEPGRGETPLCSR